MAERLDNKSILIYDHGYHPGLAMTLAESYGHVYYHVPSESSLPTMNLGKLGTGISDIDVIDNIFPVLDKIDMAVFTDIGEGKTQDWLRKQGMRVWGAGSGGERLERDRVWTKKRMTSLGLPVGPYEVVKGITALRAYLQAHDNQVVKLSNWRGHWETTTALKYWLIQSDLNNLQHDITPWEESTEFVVEEMIDGIEAGVDTFIVNGQIPELVLTGIEAKDEGYVMKFVKYANLHPAVTQFTTAMQSYFAEVGYCGFFSDETRITKQQVGYTIDPTCRVPEPPGSAIQLLYHNLPIVMWEGAGGQLVEPIPAAPYGVEIVIKSETAATQCQPIRFSRKYAKFIKLHNCCKVGNQWYIIPQAIGACEIGAVIGLGSSVKAAFEMAKEVAASIEGPHIKVADGSIDKIREQLDIAKSYGVDIFGGK